MDKPSGIEEIQSKQIHRWVWTELAQNFCGIRWLLGMILFHDTMFSEIACEVINITFIFLEVHVWQFPNYVSSYYPSKSFYLIMLT